MTVAQLGFKIDSTQASSAAVDLEKLTAAATRTQQAADRLEAETAALGSSLGKAGQGARGAQAPVEALGRSFGTQDDHVRAFRLEIERLTAKYQPMAQATKAYEAAVGEINRAHQLGVINAGQMQKALDAERLAFERLKQSANSASQAVQAANQNNAAARATGNAGQNFNAANVGYQFQDVAVTAAMGMNPLMIGLQQGTQLASVMAMMERPVSGLATAFASLINPVSLVSIGLTAGVAALIQYGGAWFSSGADDISGDLEAQAELIARVTERWGDATPALKAYADELARAKDIEELQQAITLRTGQEYEKIAESLSTFSDRYGDFVSVLTAASNATGSQRTAISELGVAYFTLQERIEANKATVEDFDRVRQAATRAAAMEGAQELGVFRSGMDELTESTAKARDELLKLQRDAASALTSAYPSRGTYGGVLRSPDGTIQGEQYGLPFNGPVPGGRPLIELSGDGSPSRGASIINSDGWLVSVPVPGSRPNYFEREADLQFSRTNRNTYWGRDVLQEELRRQEMGTLFKGFFTDFGQALRNNSGDLGKALMEGLSNAMLNAASAAWDKVANMAANFLLNAVMGQPSAGLMNKGIGFTGANTTLGALLGAGVANDNVAGGFSGLSVGAVTRAPLADISAYASAIKSIESRGSGGYSALGPITRNGDRAYGAYQVMGNNIGPWSKEALGRSISASEFMSNPALQDQIFEHKFGSYVSKYGPSGAAQAWFGGPGSVGKGGGASDILGTTGTAYVEKFNAALGDASKSVGSFGSGLGQLGQAMSTSFFPAAPAAGGGGFGGLLGGLFGGGGMSAATRAKYLPLTGLFADGTNYAPGGWAITGERGPELVNLPQGSQVFDTNRSARMMGGNDNRGGNQRPQLVVQISGASGDDHVRELARQGAQEAIFQYNQNQVRGGALETQQKATARKG